MSEITFTMDERDDAVHCYGAALALIEEGRDLVTTQVMLLDHPATRSYDRIVLERDGESVTLERDGDGFRCDEPPCDLSRIRSIASLWLSGVLG